MNPDTGGPALQRLIVRQIPVGTMANFVYLVVDEKSKDALVVDSGWETDPITKALAELQASLKFVVATHEHFDHVSTLHDLAHGAEAKVVAHEDSPVPSDLKVKDGDELRLGVTRLKILHTPGHTEDSICIFGGREVFTGDTLFIGTIGRFDRERAEAMYSSLHNVLMKLPRSTVIYPGHDYGEVRSRTLGEESASNPFLMTRDFRSFLSLFS